MRNTGADPSTIPRTSWLLRLAPIGVWLPAYERKWLSDDAIAGLTLAAYAIPVSLAYATLAGLPPQMGLHCYLVGGVAYAVFGSSRHLAVGPTSAISLLLGVSLLELTSRSSLSAAGLASLTALVVAGIFAAAWLLRLSVMVNFISESVLTGFKAGAALVIAVTQAPKLLGVPGGGDNIFERLWMLWSQRDGMHGLTLALGATAIVLLLVGERRAPGRPVALAVVLLALAAVAIGDLDQRGVRTVGDIPTGLPRLQVPTADVAALGVLESRQLVRLACACFLLSYIESISAARTFALKHGYEVDARQELLGLGAASLAAGLWQGYPLAGGLSQSAVNERGGARTPLALVFAAIAIGCVLLFLTGLLQSLPDAVLAAVVFVAVKGLIDVRELRHLWRVSWIDFSAALVALTGVLLMGILDGVLVAVLASLLMLLGRSARPYVAILGRIPGTNRFSDLNRHPHNEPVPGIVAFRVQSSLLYFNADHVFDVVRMHVREAERLRRVVCDLSNVPYVDISGARMLKRLRDEVRALGAEFRIVEAHGPVRDILRAEGLEEQPGTISRFSSLAAAMEVRPGDSPADH